MTDDQATPNISCRKYANSATRIITLSSGDECLVDADLFDDLNAKTWHSHSSPIGHRYAYRQETKNGKQRYLSMHRFINETPDGLFTDHINGITLDNRRCNLRTVTNRQNQQNRAANKKGTSKYKGVHWKTSRNKWYSRIMFEGKRICIGLFNDEKEAAKAYNEASKRLFGRYHRDQEID